MIDELEIVTQRGRQLLRPPHIHTPLRGIQRDHLQAGKAGKDGGARLGAPTRQPGNTVGAVSDQGEIVRDRLRRDTELLHDTGFVDDLLLTPVVGHDAIAHDHLGHVLVRADNDHLIDVLDPADRGRGESVVGFEFDVAPDDDTNGLQSRLGERELTQQLLIHANRGFVPGEHLVAERLDHGVEARRQMSHSGFPQQGQGRLQYAQGGMDVVTVGSGDRVLSTEVGPEELVGTIE